MYFVCVFFTVSLRYERMCVVVVNFSVLEYDFMSIPAGKGTRHVVVLLLFISKRTSVLKYRFVLLFFLRGMS